MSDYSVKFRPMASFPPDPLWPIPQSMGIKAEFCCYHCRKITTALVPSECGYRSEAELWRAMYEKAVLRFNRIVSDVEVMQPESNPVSQYFRNEVETLFAELRRHFNE